MSENNTAPPASDRRLIEDWLPIAYLSIESLRERTPMTPFPAPNRLHVWFARRPLIASRAAILASLLPASADRDKFIKDLGIHGNPLETKLKIAKARAAGERFEGQAYTYSRAFTYLPPANDLHQIAGKSVLDPTAGGGSIPFESVRLGLQTIANDLNPVAVLILKATIEFPLCHGSELVSRLEALTQLFIQQRDSQLEALFPSEPKANCRGTNWLWARSVTCPICAGSVPLSPNWRLSSDGHGVRLHPHLTPHRHITFGIVQDPKLHSPGTVSGGVGLCPYPDCGANIPGEEIKRQAQAGQMGHTLYCVVYKEQRLKGHTKSGKPQHETVRGFRAPRPEDDTTQLVAEKLAEKMPLWQARNIIPDEAFPPDSNDTRPIQYGAPLWRDLFSPRQLYGHCISVEVFQDMVAELTASNGGKLADLDRAAMVYLAIALDKMLNYNSTMSVWMSTREVVANTFNRHDFAFCWSYSEMAPTITGLGYDWAIDQTRKSLGELVTLLGQEKAAGLQFDAPRPKPALSILLGSGDNLPVDSGSVDAVVMDPPYYDNVMYAELSDYFYVWLKRTAGLLYPDLFTSYLTDKEQEATANPAKFSDQKGNKKSLAGEDYQRRMARIFQEQRRVLKPNGVMTVMFTHKASGAWDALTRSLIEAGFRITASWPVNTEAEGSLHIRDKSAAKSTIFLVCRPQTASTPREELFWEDVEPTVSAAVRSRVDSFQASGVSGIDLYLASFGPALEVFTNHWPLRRARPLQTESLQPKRGQRKLALSALDPYAVTPEDALDVARREVKRWRLGQLARKTRHSQLDPITEWFVLAWDTFRAPVFDADEALKLARVIGLDFDGLIKKRYCEVKGANVTLWDSQVRAAKGVLPDISFENPCLLDVLHRVALLGRQGNAGGAQSVLEKFNLLGDPAFLNAFELLREVLPPALDSTPIKPTRPLGGAQADYLGLERLRQLALVESLPEREIPEQLLLSLSAKADDEDSDKNTDEDDDADEIES